MHSRSRAEKARAPRRAAIMETLAMKVRASRREELLPLPRGEGWGEGVRASEQKLGLPNPLILSFSPISAFTRVFDALWGRRDAACRPSPDGMTRMLHFFGRPLHMIRRSRDATRAQ